MTQREAARILGWNQSTVERYVRRYQLPRPRGRTGPVGGPTHYNWRGGRILDKGGYVLVRCEDHPSGRRYVREHRLVMERALGRCLAPGEVVHHENGVRDDNRLENLRLFAQNSDHLRHELTGRVPRWSENGLARMREAVIRSLATRRQRKESGARP